MHISKRADCVVEHLKDSGSFLEWAVNIATGGMKQLIGHALEIDIAEESRTASDAGEIYKGRQLYARIFAFYTFDVQNNALMILEDLQTAKMQSNDTKKCLRDWDVVFSRLEPDFQKLFTGKVEVEMFYKLIKDAPHHERHFRDWGLYNEVDGPDRWSYMHSMTYIRRVIRSYYDTKLRDANRGKHHLGIQRGVPGFYQVISGADAKPGGPAPNAPSGSVNGPGGGGKKPKKPKVAAPAGMCSQYWTSGVCACSSKPKGSHQRPNGKSQLRYRSTPAAPGRTGNTPRTPRGSRKGGNTPRQSTPRGRSTKSRFGSRTPRGSRKQRSGSRTPNGTKRRKSGSRTPNGTRKPRSSSRAPNGTRKRGRTPRPAAPGNTPRPGSNKKGKRPQSANGSNICYQFRDHKYLNMAISASAVITRWLRRRGVVLRRAVRMAPVRLPRRGQVGSYLRR